jgi:Tol biopolymer transport system component
LDITAGGRLGPYELIAPAGAGGMGEVWRARDTRLDRTVAIKVLPSHLSSNPQLRERFDREARAISSLTDVHICTLYDVGHQDGIDYIVMEYLEGESLSDRLTKGALPIGQVLRYGTEIAEGLDKAHRQGIVHRDLKPGNIMLTKSGAKLLDFGLAKMVETGEVIQFSTLATAQKQLTAEGTIVGTFQYMAPEQLEGAEADARTDIFALGAVLYEMATGRKAFEGKNKTSLIAAIVDRDPPLISSIQAMTPPALDRVVRSCLAKEPDDRWQSAKDVASELKWISEAGSQAGVAAPIVHRRKHREALAWTIAAALLVAAAAFAYLWYRATAEPPRRIEASILPPEDSDFIFTVAAPALSPDGARIAYPVRAADGKVELWVRRLDNGAAQALEGTESASAPFWSPDSRTIGFFSKGRLLKIDASGGPPQVLCEAAAGRGGTWGPNGLILFSPGDRDGLYSVSASGGVPAPVTRLEPNHEYSHRWPAFLPDGMHYLYLAEMYGSEERGRIYLGTIGSNTRRALVSSTSPAAYSSAGYLLYCRDRALVAQQFDARSLELKGDATVIADGIYTFGPTAMAAFSVSRNGVLAYQRGTTGLLSQLVWMDRTGKQLGIVSTPGDYNRPQLAHDGRHLAFEIWDAKGDSDIWIYDLARQTSTRFTFGPGSNSQALWSRDDQFIVYSSEQAQRGARDVVRKSAAGMGSPETLFSLNVPFLATTDWSWDGRYVFFHGYGIHPKTGSDVYYYSIPDKKLVAAVQTPYSECCGRLSPDGHWLAYASNESGRNEIYVQPFPTATGKWQISTTGGTQPRWRSDEREIFYQSPDNKIVAVDIRATSTLEPGVPKALFGIHPKLGGWPYDVAPDGQRFLINETVHAAGAAPVTIVVNWTAELKK